MSERSSLVRRVLDGSVSLLVAAVLFYLAVQIACSVWMWLILVALVLTGLAALAWWRRF